MGLIVTPNMRNKKTLDVALALLLFLATTFISSIYLYGFISLYIASLLLLVKGKFKLPASNIIVLYLFLVIYFIEAIIISLAGFDEFSILKGNPFIGGLMLISMLLVSSEINTRVIRYLVYFIIFEVFIAIVEYSIGQPYLFKLQVPAASMGNSSITNFQNFNLNFYNNKVFGLGQSSSSLSYKIVFFLAVCSFLKIKFNKFIIFMLFVGMLLSFSRIGMLAFFVLIYFMAESKLLSNLVILAVGCLILVFLQQYLSELFFKGMSVSLDLFADEKFLNALTSSRFDIWGKFIENCQLNYFLGNLGQTVFIDVDYTITSNPHNTIIYLLSKHGVAILFLYLYIFYLISKKGEIKYFVPIFIYSLTSTSFGYYFSIYDIFIFYLVLYLPRLNIMRERRC